MPELAKRALFGIVKIQDSASETCKMFLIIRSPVPPGMEMNEDTYMGSLIR